MESRPFQEQAVPDHQRIVSGGSNSPLQRPSPCPHHVHDSLTARTVLATILEIVTAFGDDLNSAYVVPQQCPMLKCFHFSATPMQQIQHVTVCTEASKGEIRCWTCRKCHDFKRWHAVCSTLKSPVDLLWRRLSNRKRGSNPSTGEPSATKRGKMAVNDEFTNLSRHESHGVETLWPREMEDPTSLFLSGVPTTSSPAQLHAVEHNSIHMPELGGSSAIQALPTPPATRNHSWSEDSQDLAAYGDAKVANVPEQLPPYVVSPQTTVDDYGRHHNPTDSIRLGIPPVQFIHESTLTESPEDLEFSEANHIPWSDHAAFREAEGPQGNSRLLPTALDTTVSQYSHSSEKSASIFSSSFPASRMPNPHRQKQHTWPARNHHSNYIPSRSFDRQQPQLFDAVSGLPETDDRAGIATQQDTSIEHSIARQTSFDSGATDSITVSTFEDRRLQITSRAPEDDHQASAKRSTAGQHQHTAKNHRHHHHHHHHQYEECTHSGPRFGGIAKNRKQHLRRHVESKHGGARFRCAHQRCDRSYNRADNLHEHERRCHGAQEAEVAELAAGDVEVHHGGPGGQYPVVFTAAAEGSAPDTGHQASSAAGPVFGYSISTEEGHDWRPAVGDDIRDPGARRIAGFTEEDWDALMAGVSGGQHDMEEEAGVPDGRHGEADNPEEEDALSMGMDLVPRPLDVPYASWRLLGD